MNFISAFSLAPQLSERLSALTTRSAGTLRLTAVRNRYAVLLSASGEIDAANADAWECGLAEAGAATEVRGLLLVDARELHFMGSVAFAVLARQSDRCWQDGTELRMISTQSGVDRVIEICGLQVEIPAYRSVAAALERRVERAHVSSSSASADMR